MSLYRDLEPALATAQRAKKPKRVRAIHTKIANRRKDFLHKLSTELTSPRKWAVDSPWNQGRGARAKKQVDPRNPAASLAQGVSPRSELRALGGGLGVLIEEG